MNTPDPFSQPNSSDPTAEPGLNLGAEAVLADELDRGECVEAGQITQFYSQAVGQMTPTQQQQIRQQMQLQSRLFTEMRQWLDSLGLGIGSRAAYIAARERIRTQLDRLDLQQQQHMVSNLAQPGTHWRQPLAQLLDLEDWQHIAAAAAQAIAAQVESSSRQLSTLEAIRQ